MFAFGQRKDIDEEKDALDNFGAFAQIASEVPPLKHLSTAFSAGRFGEPA